MVPRSGSTVLVSRADGAAGANGNGRSFTPSACDDSHKPTQVHGTNNSRRRGLPERLFDPLAEVGGSVDVIGLESAGQCAAQFPLRLRGFECKPIDADPGAAPRSSGADVRRNLSVGAERQADQVAPGGMGAAQDAFTLGRMRFAL